MKQIFYALLFCPFFTVLSAQNGPAEAADFLKKIQKKQAPARQAHSRSGETCNPDSTHTYTKAPGSNDSVLINRVVSEYNQNGLLIHSTDEELNDLSGQLELAFEYTYNYNAQNVLVFEQVKSVQNGNFGVMSENHYFPTGASTVRLDSLVSWDADFATNMLLRSLKTEYTYLSDDKLETEAAFIYSDATGWEPYSVSIHAYNGKGQPTHIEASIWNGMTYEPDDLTEYFYAANDSLVQVLETDLTTNLPTGRQTLEYDIAAKSVQTTFESYDETTASWTEFGYATNDLDALDRLELFEFFVDFSGLFQFGNRLVFHYPGTSDCISFYENFETTDGIDWVKTGNTYFYYDGSIVPVNSLIYNELGVKIAPNPFSENFQIEAPAGSSAQVFSTTGKLVFEAFSTGEKMEVDGAGLPNGSYFVFIKNGENSVVKLVVKMD